MRRIVGGLVFIITFIVYTQTLCPTVAPKDSGELVTAAYTFGIAHPPGYPLFVMLGKLFTFLPLGSIAWRVNLMSAFFASSTVLITYAVILTLTGSVLAGAVGALLLGFSPVFWSLAVVAEVFQLNALFAALTFYLLLIWKEKKDFRLLLLFAFIYGLSLTNHHTMLLLAPAYLYFIWSTEKLKNPAGLIACFLLGLLPYLFLPLRSLQNPYLDWGNPETLENFMAVLTRAQYGTGRLDTALPKASLDFSLALTYFNTYFSLLINQFTLAGFLLGLFGAIHNFKKNLKIFVFLALLFLMSGLFFVFLAGYPLGTTASFPYCLSVLRRFMLPSFLVYAVWIGIGSATILRLKKYKILAVCLIILLPTASLLLHYNKADMSKYYFAEDLAGNLLLSLPPNSIIFVNADSTAFGLWYLQGVEGKRPDVKIIRGNPQKWCAYQLAGQWPDLVPGKIDAYAGGEDFLRAIIARNLGKHPLFVDIDTPESLKSFYRFFAPHGLIYEIAPSDSTGSKLASLKANEYLWGKYRYRSPLSTADGKDYNTSDILTFYAEGHNFAGVVLALSGDKKKARAEFQTALEISPGYPSALINLRRVL